MRQLRFTLLLAAVAAALFLSACSRGESSDPVRTYSMGERIDLGHIVYTVFETQWMTQLGERDNVRVPQHRYFLIRMSAVNGAGGDLIVPNVSIEDDSGNTYTELSDGDGVPQWIGFLRQVRPAEAAQGNVLFDAPPRHYKVRLMDEIGDHKALVDIPLSFTAETPEVPVPNKDREKDRARDLLRK
jgi:hypothetical protein